MKNQKRNFIWNTIGITWNAFTSLFFLIIVNRVNGIEIAGIFSYAFSLACLFYVIALYFNRTYQVADVKGIYRENQYITNRLLTSFLTILLCILFAIVNKFSILKTSILILLMLYKILEAISDCFHAFIQKKDQLYYVGKSLFWKSIVGVTLFASIDYFTQNIILSILSCVLVNFIGLGVDIKKYYRLYEIRFKIDLQNSFKLLKNAFPLFIFSFLMIYLCNCQKYIMEYFADDSYQTILGIIIMPATMLSLCGQYLISPYLNELSHKYDEEKIKEFKKIMTRITTLFLLLGIIVFIIAFFLGIPVLNLIYSIALNEYKKSFLLIIIGAIFYALSTIISNGLTVMKKNKEQLYIYISSAVFATIISWVLIKRYAIFGASLAYLIIMAVHFLLSLILLQVYLKREK